MKPGLLTVLIVATAAECLAQSPSPAPKSHSLNLAAQSISSGGAARLFGDAQKQYDNATRMTDGSQVPIQFLNLDDQQHVLNGENLEIKVRNFSGSSDKVKIDWFFFAFPYADNMRIGQSKDFIFDRGSQDITVPSGQVMTCVATSKELLSTVSRSTSILSSRDPSVTVTYQGGADRIQSSSQTGFKLKGWCVRILDGDRIIATTGSSQNYQDLARDDAKLKEMISAAGLAR